MTRVLCIVSVGVLIWAAFGNDSTAGQTESATATVADTVWELQFTPEELAEYNGRDGKPLYVVVDSIVYDFSEVKAWKKGRHHGHKGGTDLTKEIAMSPHKKVVLKKRKKIGRLVASHVKP